MKCQKSPADAANIPFWEVETGDIVDNPSNQYASGSGYSSQYTGYGNDGDAYYDGSHDYVGDSAADTEGMAASAVISATAPSFSA